VKGYLYAECYQGRGCWQKIIYVKEGQSHIVAKSIDAVKVRKDKNAEVGIHKDTQVT
jgi:hypothetical protein